MSDRVPVLARLDELARSVEGLERVIELRRTQAAARARWWESRPPPPAGTARSVSEHLARLAPRRTRLDLSASRGRALRVTEAVAIGEVLLDEEALASTSGEKRKPAPWQLVPAIARLDGDGRALVDDLANAHALRAERYAELARGLGRRGIDLGVDPGVLEAGEEMTISYVDPTWPARWRLVVLLDRYGFVCDCPRCAEALARGEVDREEVRRLADEVENEFQAAAS